MRKMFRFEVGGKRSIEVPIFVCFLPLKRNLDDSPLKMYNDSIG